MTQLYLVRRPIRGAMVLVDESGAPLPGQVSVSASTAGGECATVTVTFLLRDGVGRGVHWSEPPAAPAEQLDESGWTDWAGGDCPLPPATLCEVVLRSGHRPPPRRASQWQWEHYAFGPSSDEDIIKYRVTGG